LDYQASFHHYFLRGRNHLLSRFLAHCALLGQFDWVKYTEEINNLHFEWSNLSEEIEQEKVGVTLGGLEEKGELEKLQIDRRKMRAELDSFVSANINLRS